MTRSRVAGLALLAALCVVLVVRETVRFDDPSTQAILTLAATIVVAATAVAGLGFTWTLLGEERRTRNLRLAAEFDLAPIIWPSATTILALEARNYGPAVARDLVITVRLRQADGDVAGERTHAQPALAPGQRLTMLPMDVISKGLTLTLDQMARDTLTLDVDWAWRDDMPRPRSSLGADGRVHRSKSWPTMELRDGFYGGIVQVSATGDPAGDAMVLAIAKLTEEVRLLKRVAEQRNLRDLARSEAADRRGPGARPHPTTPRRTKEPPPGE